MSMLGSVIKGLLQQIIESTPFPTDLHDRMSNFVESELVRSSVCSRFNENSSMVNLITHIKFEANELKKR